MSIDIAAPPETVWNVVMDPKRLGDWVTIHRGLNSHSSGEPRVGYRMDQSMVLRGAPFKVKWELVRCERPRLAEWHGKGPARSHAETGYRLEPIDGGTRFHYFNEFKAPLGPLGSLASRVLVGGLPDKEAKATLAKLKALLEK
jgi:carbon monoxide dehydrogenase subunit G